MSEQTYGQRAVGLKFNPSSLNEVDSIKKIYADAIDMLNDLREATSDGERKRLYSVAITETQTAQMWAVKGMTYSL